MTDIWAIAFLYFVVRMASDFEAGRVAAGCLGILAAIFCGFVWISSYSTAAGNV
jgi:hypothetical protein